MAEERGATGEDFAPGSDPTPAAAGASPLSGKRVLVTRAGDQAADLSRLLIEAGAHPVEIPTIQLEPPESWDPVDDAISGLERYDWVVFTSVNGVRSLFERMRSAGRDSSALRRTEVAAIGPATAEALIRRGIRPAFVPDEYVAEAIVEGLLRRGIVGKQVLVARAAEAREVLVDALRERGAMVDEVHVYRTVVAESSRPLLRAALDTGLDVATFASPSSVKNLLALMGGGMETSLGNCVVACIGPITARAASAAGFRVDVVAREYTIPGLVRALEEHFRTRRD